MDELRKYIIERIEFIGNPNIYHIGMYSPEEGEARLRELKRLAEHFRIDVGPTHNFNFHNPFK